MASDRSIEHPAVSLQHLEEVTVLHAIRSANVLAETTGSGKLPSARGSGAGV